ncbi:MAG: hypothetical protein AAF196_08865 [Planctomycetota bacterium]
MTSDDPNADQFDELNDARWPELEAEDSPSEGPSPSGPPISADFVERTLGRVLEDRAQIDEEAERVDSFEFPRGFLQNYEVPATSPGFVQRTLDALADDDEFSQSAEDRELSRLLRAFGPDSISGGFVDRTLDALHDEQEKRDDEEPLRSALPHYELPPVSANFVDRTLETVLADREQDETEATPSNVHSMWSWRGAALRLAAAVLVSAGIVFFAFDDDDLPTQTPGANNDVAEAPSDLDLHLATNRLGTQLEDDEEILRVETVDPLILMMQQAALAQAQQSPTRNR